MIKLGFGIFLGAVATIILEALVAWYLLIYRK